MQLLQSMIAVNCCTLGSQINVPLRLLSFEDFSHQYALIPASMFIYLSNYFNLRSNFNRKFTNKIGIIRQYFGWIFQLVHLFQPVRLLILTNFPTSTFIPDFRVFTTKRGFEFLTSPFLEIFKEQFSSRHQIKAYELKT
jgi:hypothetical protein